MKSVSVSEKQEMEILGDYNLYHLQLWVNMESFKKMEKETEVLAPE